MKESRGEIGEEHTQEEIETTVPFFRFYEPPVVVLVVLTRYTEDKKQCVRLGCTINTTINLQSRAQWRLPELSCKSNKSSIQVEKNSVNLSSTQSKDIMSAHLVRFLKII